MAPDAPSRHKAAALGVAVRAGAQRVVRARLWSDVAALGLLVLATLGFFWRVVAGQNWMPADGGDLVSFLYPTYRFAAAALHRGVWPLWNPYLYLGAPHAGDIQAGFLYPPNLLLFLLRPDFPYSALQALSIGHIWFAGAGMYLFLARGQRIRRRPALAGAVAFMFSDAFIVHFGNLNFNAVASWTPWVFWAFSAGLNGNEERPLNFKLAALSGVALAVASLAGHIQATLFILLALALYTALVLWGRRAAEGGWRRAAAHLGYLLLATAVTALLAAPVLLPALQLAGYTARAAWNYTEAAGYSLSPAQWIGWLIPGFFGRGPQFHWGAWPRVEVGYLGILPLVLAGLALFLRRDRRSWAWCGLALASFVIALGTYSVPHGWLTLLPGFGQLRAPARMVLVTDFALAALAGIGLDAALGPLAAEAQARLGKATRGVGYATAAVWAFAVPLAYLALLLVQNQDQAIVIRISITLIAVMIFAGLLAACLFWLAAARGGWARPDTLAWAAVILIVLDLASNGAYQDLGNTDPSQAFQKPAIAGFLAAQPGPYRIDTRTGIEGLWQPDTALLYGLEDVGGLANPLLLADVGRYWEGLGSRSSRLYDLLNARYVIAKKDVTLDWQKFKLAFDGDHDLNVYLNESALPRAFVAPAVQVAASHEAAWGAIHAPGFDPAASAVVEDPDGVWAGRISSGAPAGGAAVPVAMAQSAPGRVTLRATLDQPGLLLVSQVWYPGWQVRVDGVAQGEPLRADYIFQGIPLAAGTHQVEMTFTSPAWRTGWMIAAACALALVVWSLVGVRARRSVRDGD